MSQPYGFQQSPVRSLPTSPVYGGASAATDRVTAFLRTVYAWMFIGLALTAGTAFAVSSSPKLVSLVFGNPLTFWGVMLAQLGVVFFLGARINRLAPLTAGVLFLAYSGLTGLTLSVVLLAYTGASVAGTFIVASGMFAATAAFGLTTRRSLAGLGQFLFMGLIGLVLASVVGIFWHSDALQFVLGIVGVIVFTGLAAWDNQRLKEMALAVPGERLGAYAIVGALSLYLDFINLFLSLLRLFGSRRD